jgi:hypothetical protein
MAKILATPSQPTVCWLEFLWRLLAAGLWLAVLAQGPAARAAAGFQFDVFLGFDEKVRDANWFPVACEVFNDGPTFKAVFELTTEGAGGGGQKRRLLVELPTNTRKRFVIPVFASRFGSWTARLLDENGKIRAEKTSMRAREEIAAGGILIGGVARSFGGLPVLPETRARRGDARFAVARLDVNIFPDNPVALEGLDLIYLNTFKALDLKAPQYRALLDWLYGGGHLVVGIDQPSDLNGAPWLRNLLPAQFTDVTVLKLDGTFDEWVRPGRGSESDPTTTINTGGKRRNAPNVRPAATLPPLTPDVEFADSDLPAAVGSLGDGRATYSLKGTPLVIEADRGRGKITVLAFDAERKPFASWKNRDRFWSRLANVPNSWYDPQDNVRYGGWSIDAVFGAMIDSKQVRKLPVSWLLLLLTVYLLVIGPVDQIVLKKINRQMLTWITFPAYVVFFSAFIYWIGFKLRAGETEWNELHVVDVLPLPNGEQAQLRGHTFASVYSPANARYEVASDQSFSFATVRGEFQGPWSGGQESSRANVEQRGDGFRADLFVPVWVSQLYVSDWLRAAPMPLKAIVGPVRSGSFSATIENKLSRPLTEARLVAHGRIYLIGALASGQSTNLTLTVSQGTQLQAFVQQQGNQFNGAVSSRRQAFGDERAGRIEDLPINAMAASFCDQLGQPGQSYTFVAPERFDLSALAEPERGFAILLAWDAGNSPAPALNKFTPRRVHRDTLLRLAVPVKQ